MTLSIKIKITCLAVLGSALLLVVGGSGYFGIQKLSSSMEDIVNDSKILKNHLTADIMRDALGSDVLSSLLAADQNDVSKLASIQEDFNEHSSSFKKFLSNNSRLIRDQKLQSQLKETLPVLENYIEAAADIISLAGQNRYAAGQKMGAFNSTFDALTIKMEALTTTIEKSIYISQNEGDTAIVTSSNISLLLLVIGLVLLSGASWFIGNTISAPLKKLIGISEKIADGDLSVAVDVSGTDETGQLAQSLEAMRISLLEMVNNIASTSEQLTNSAKNISAITAQTSSNIHEQQLETEQVASAMNEMTATVQEVANNITNTSNAANEANVQTSVGSEVVSETVEHIQALASQIGQSSEIINELERNSEEISSVLDVIKSIAEQTNLLALNAAIEAARAGEQGRGFAVVADEVRTLAGRTQQSTEEINQMIDQLQAGTKSAVESMNSSREKAHLTVEQADKAGETLSTIAASVSQINDMSAQIASAAEQQGAVSDEINNNILRISNMANEAADGAQQTSESSNELSEIAAQLQSIIHQFKT